MIFTTYKPNPLHPFVEIGSVETNLIINTVLAENLTNYIADLKPFFEKGEVKEKIKKEIIDFTFIDRITKDSEEFASVLITSLKDKHCGDCTSVPCTCPKCYLEDILGIDTLSHFKDPTGKYKKNNILYSVQLKVGELIKKGISSDSMLFLDELIKCFKKDDEENKTIHNLLLNHKDKVKNDKNYI